MTSLRAFASLLLLSLLSLTSSTPLTDLLRPVPRSPLTSILKLTTPAAPQAPAQVSLDDPPVLGTGHIALSGTEWTASSPSLGLTIPATVPGDLIMDLFHAGVIPEPIYEMNWLNASIWNDHTWVYNRTVSLSAEQFRSVTDAQGAGDIALVFDGIKMGANIYMNGVQIGQALAQFERLVFSLRAIASNASLSGALQQGANVLSVEFDHRINTPLFMQCTGGWDWAPYSNTTTADGKEATFSRGIWKAVYLVSSPGGVFLTDIAPLITYNGPFPTSALSDGSHGGFTLNLTVYMTVTRALPNATLEVQPSWRSSPLTFHLPALPPSSSTGLSTLIRVSAADVDLWWPQGLGAQPLYDLSVRVNTGARGVLSGSRRIGFRFFAIVTGNDTNAAYVEQNADADGTDTQGMRFRINGAPLFVRGANVIPMDNNEGRYTAAGHRRMVLSAAQGGMNIMRIWGGGVFLPSIFYATADEAGVMVYHDMMNRDYFSGMAQEVNAYRNTIRRLSTHPSIVIWDGCNECNPNQGENRHHRHDHRHLGGLVARDLALVPRGGLVERRQPPVLAAQWEGAQARRLVHEGACAGRGGRAGQHRDARAVPARGRVACGERRQHAHQPVRPDAAAAAEPDGGHRPGPPQHVHVGVRLGGLVVVGVGESDHRAAALGAARRGAQGQLLGRLLVQVHTQQRHGAAQVRPHSNRPRQSLLLTASAYNSFSPIISACLCSSYPCDSILLTYFGGQQSDLDVVGEQAFKKQLWQCLYGQALVLKTYIEQHRSTNTYGLQIWQLNEIWPTGGWGTIEWGPADYPGQVRTPLLCRQTRVSAAASCLIPPLGLCVVALCCRWRAVAGSRRTTGCRTTSSPTASSPAAPTPRRATPLSCSVCSRMTCTRP